MTTFAQAVQNNSNNDRTENGMSCLKSSTNNCVDLFYAIGASRGQNIIPKFTLAYQENPDIAIRIALWARDIRGGCGERQLFKDIISELSKINIDHCRFLIRLIPEIGRWDDLFPLLNTSLKDDVINVIKETLSLFNSSNYSDIVKLKTLVKWMPREKSAKKDVAIILRKSLGMAPKQYRKLLSALTDVVESKMCANKWDEIDYSAVPSLAHSRYKSAFNRHSPEKYYEYAKDLADGKTKINAGAVYPYDVLKSIMSDGWNYFASPTERTIIQEQWNTLENFIGDNKILPMVDVSGSMNSSVGGNLTALQVAVSLGLYCADKNTGDFKDLILTFSRLSEIMKVSGDIVDKYEQLANSNWGMNTDLHLAFDNVLKVAVDNVVADSDMPKYILILSDMAFDTCTSFDDSAYQMIQRKYSEAGYTTPKIIFWNLLDKNNVPVKSNIENVALVSGFSPSIMKVILKGGDTSTFTPEYVMLDTVMNDRYNWLF